MKQLKAARYEINKLNIKNGELVAEVNELITENTELKGRLSKKEKQPHSPHSSSDEKLELNHEDTGTEGAAATLSEKQQLQQLERDIERLRVENDKLKVGMIRGTDLETETPPDLEAGEQTSNTTTTTPNSARRKSVKEQVSQAKRQTMTLKALNKKLKEDPKRRKSSTLLATQTYQRPMKTLKDFRFCISLRPLFTESGKLAAMFEIHQFFIVVLEVIPSLAYLQALNWWEPLTMLFAMTTTLGNSAIGNATDVSNITMANATSSMFDDDAWVNTTPNNITSLYGEELISVMDPVGYTSIIVPSTLAWAMSCSFAAQHDSYFVPHRMNFELIAGFVAILSVCSGSVWFFSELMGSSVSFFVVDIPHIAVGYVLWQLYIFRTSKKYKPKLRHPRVNQAFGSDPDAESLNNSAKRNTLITSTLIPMVLTTMYMFVLIPSFQSFSPLFQTMIRIFGHSTIKSQSDVRQRDGFATGIFKSTVKLNCQSMFPMECIWAIAGRFLISAGNPGFWLVVTLVGVSGMEWSMRVNAECLEGAYLQLLGQPLLTGQALDNYRIAEAASQAQDDAVEQGAIMIVGAVQLLLVDQRAALGLGLGAVAPAKAKIVSVVALQLAVEVPTDVVTTAQLIDDGLNVHKYYDDVDEDGVITPHTLPMKIGESFSFGMGLSATLMFFRIAPIPVFCTSGDVCSCSFYKEELAKLCASYK